MNTPRCLLTALLLAGISSFLLQPSSLRAQGSLNPPGAPAPLFKTLSQVEPRTPISAVHFTITNSGSYYLTTNLIGFTNQDGIRILTSDVTLDLNGFALIGGVSNSLSGIASSNNLRNLTVLNGALSQWGSNGLSLASASNCQIRGISCANNFGAGIIVGGDSLVLNCTVHSNRNFGINASNGCVVQNCTASLTTGIGQGFRTGNGCTISHCAAFTNAGHGIIPSSGSVVTDCTSQRNGGVGIFANNDQSTIQRCDVHLNGGDGIQANSSLVTDCRVSRNGGNGINASFSTVRGCHFLANTNDGMLVILRCLILDNYCDGAGSGRGMTNACIRVTFPGNRIEGNHLVNHDNALVVSATNNLIIRNSANFCSTNYLITSNNMVGPTNTVFGVVTNHPWANFSF